jgi:Icc-related predicted phosphoesterase
MNSRGRSNYVLTIIAVLALRLAAQTPPPELKVDLHQSLEFVAFGDTRFTDPSDTEAANPAARRALVRAIADEKPAFVSIGGDIVYNGNDANDWATYDEETSAWNSAHIAVFPALGNHDLHGDPSICLPNYFKRYPDLQGNRFYSVRAGSVLMLTLDSSLEELDGPQGEWMKRKLDSLPKDVGFVVVVLHHPPYTSSSDSKEFGGGHSARKAEQALAGFLEAEQQKLTARIVVFSGHVHNYERHAHGGVTYFVTGGGGAHAYPISRKPDDLFQSREINYHYLRVSVDGKKMKVTMRRLELKKEGPAWTDGDSVVIGS